VTSDRRTKRGDPVGPHHCVVGEELREVAVLSEAQWEALGPGHRPSPAVHVPGLGLRRPVPGGGRSPGRPGRKR
jgi:hypothetical protein